ncbi:MAG: two pore domain potassium channel family protein [Chloroflexi bacterium]|nr:two pore domain potassium channel family protein [Chloroflexota bacterium]
MEIIGALLGLLLILGTLWDAFETIVLPRRVTRRFRLAKFFYRLLWVPWAAVGRRRDGTFRETFLSYFGPLSLLMLLTIWAIALIVGFAFLQYSLGSDLASPDGPSTLGMDLYMSGTTFFTLGFGDVVPRDTLPRIVAVVESGTGFAFLGLIIGYVPATTQAFSRREISVSMLDERAGSPPSALELIRRGSGADVSTIAQFLYNWEGWSAELLDSHLSYPILCYFRSQHDNQSWVAGLTTILDACALGMVGIGDAPIHQAQLTFAIARHAAVDLSQILSVAPEAPAQDRLPPDDLAKMRAVLAESGIHLRGGPEADEKLAYLRTMYEPYVNALSNLLLMALPPWIPAEDAHDAWQTTSWEYAERDHLS